MEIEQIITEHSDYLLKVAYLYVKNEATAEDIVQDVFIAFYQKQEQFRQESSYRTYLVKMTVNRSHDYLRSWKSKRLSLFEKITGRTTTVTPEKELLAKSTKRELVDALFTLSVPYREVLILYYFEDMTTVEIAQLVRCPEATVRTRLQRARKQLATAIGDYDWEVLRHESI
ncbi:RNA polymerase sigma factor [Lysinibacillus sp. NPDC048646]|uniref:RNA polymerase sigma factor n=1 Tax=Lysinibacillus sp. NPDC048646 TaxID=3390574 RepID=UPI003D08DCEA